ncbi:MAG: proline dehydrogenase family protein [Candidatus Marinimicrobia bacterium]|nr:proline dehydrogenase family protein [Candidatus Neomarinimicrobiota bacterium]
MKIFNNLIAAILPHFPHFLVRPFAKPYVAGETLTEAIKHAKELNQSGYKVTLDILGEHVQTIAEADLICKAYCALLEDINSERLDSTISFKLTHVGLELNQKAAIANTLTITEKAKSLDIPVTIDMENSPYTDATINIYQRAHSKFNKVGMVLQAYLIRSLEDLKTLDATNFHLRICKGIYREAADIALQNREEIRTNFINLTQTLLNGHGFAAIATHDKVLIDALTEWIEDNKIPKNRFEFQVLHGVPMGDRLERLLARGYTIRIYMPFGSAWFDYAVRRLKENPDLAGYIIGNLFKRKTSKG